MNRLFSIQVKIPAIAAILLILAFSCQKKNYLATVTTYEVSDITSQSASAGGEVSDDGGSPVSMRGVCWSIHENPTIADNKTIDGAGSGSFSSEINGLTPDSVYYVKAYATNGAGTAYGSAVSFKANSTSSSTGTFTDIRDGHEYLTVRIGTQTWMAVNLAYLPSVSGPEDGSLTQAHYYVYGYDGTFVDSAKKYRHIYKDPDFEDTLRVTSYKAYGVLYNWPAARGACPAGWRLPAEADWERVIKTLGSNAGGKMKESGILISDADTTHHWIKPNTGASNSSGFTAIPGGERYSLGSDTTVLEKFRYINRSAVFWSSAYTNGQNSWAWHLYYDNNRIDRDWFLNSNGFSVRCVKD